MQLQAMLNLSFHPSPSHLPFLLSSRHVPRLRFSASLSSLQSVGEATSILTSIILAHESGHFLAASLLGIRISQFSIGFGPPLARFSLPSSSGIGTGIEFSLRAIPLGGFVSFPDPEDPSFPDSSLSPLDPDLLRNRPLPHRLLVVSSGVLANLLFAYLLLLSQSLSLGSPARLPLPGILVPHVLPLSPASSAGLLPNDVILNAPSLQSLVEQIKSNPGNTIPLLISRSATSPSPFILNVVPDADGRIGVHLSPNFKLTTIRPANISQAIMLSGREFVALTAAVLEGFKEAFLNISQTAGKVAGPVAIIAAGAEVARSGPDGLFQFAAVINLNLAVINLLPLPALDGGTMALLLVEAARGGRRLNREVEQRIMSSGFLVVLMLGFMLIVKDTLSLDFVKDML